MVHVCFSQMAHAEKMGDSSNTSSGKNQGTLKSDGKEHSVYLFSDSESASEGVSKFLQEANSQEALEESLQDFEFVHISQELIDSEEEIYDLLKQLNKSKEPEKNSEGKQSPSSQSFHLPKESNKSEQQPFSQHNTSQQNPASKGRSEVVYSSLFSLAHTFNTSLSESKHLHKKEEQKHHKASESRTESRHTDTSVLQTAETRNTAHEEPLDREGEERKQHDESDQESDNSPYRQHKGHIKGAEKKKKGLSIGALQASRSTSAQTRASSNPSENSKSTQPVGSIENIYIRFMALMARILGQAELEAHQLYLRIKERTDAIDTLTLFISKINSEKGAIDWSNNEEMKALIQKARAIGVDIPEGKLKWSEEEKKLLKENVQMRKDSMEKVTQLERTDMQRYLQEASQCHQARSNVLKLLKEVIDTFIHNIRPS